jgi:hypothetical protein
MYNFTHVAVPMENEETHLLTGKLVSVEFLEKTYNAWKVFIVQEFTLIYPVHYVR